MKGPVRPGHAARGYLARLVVVVGVLAGLALGQGMQCTEGMTAMAIEHVASSGMAVGVAPGCVAPAAGAVGYSPHHITDVTAADPTHQVTTVCGVPDAAGVVAFAGPEPAGLPDQGDMLAACLAFIVVVLAIITGLRPPPPRIVVRMLTSRRAAVVRAVAPRASSLAERCLLRM